MVPCVPDGGSIAPLLQQHPSETQLCHIALAHSSCPYIHLHTQSYMTMYSPPSGSICTLHTLQAIWLVLLHLYRPTWAQMMGNILSLTTHLKHSVRWPRTSANVNDALSASGHQLAKGAVGRWSIIQEKKLEASRFLLAALTSNIITPCVQPGSSREQRCHHNYRVVIMMMVSDSVVNVLGSQKLWRKKNGSLIKGPKTALSGETEQAGTQSWRGGSCWFIRARIIAVTSTHPHTTRTHRTKALFLIAYLTFKNVALTRPDLKAQYVRFGGI